MAQINTYMRKDDLEFRWSDFNKRYELVRWFKKNNEDKEFCIVVATYYKKSEGYEISFVGYRPFQVDDEKLLWRMLKYGQDMCNAIFDLENE